MLPKGSLGLQYIYKAPLKQLESDLEKGEDNPNDLIGYADWLVNDAGSKAATNAGCQLLYQKALLLFNAGINAIEENPGLLDGDIELGMAYFKYAYVLYRFKNVEKARKVLEKAIASGHETPSMRKLLSSLSKISSADLDLEIARQSLAMSAIELSGHSSPFSIYIELKKSGWSKPMPHEVAQVYQNDSTFTVLVTALPYFCGPNWLEITGGKPLALECSSLAEVVEILRKALAKRLVNGILNA